GDRSFAAGDYSGTALEDLSPLASSPPAPTTHWILLADSSGSMAGRSGSGTRWARAAEALGRLVPALPPEDLVSLGNFSGGVQWWVEGRPARDLHQRPVTPPA